MKRFLGESKSNKSLALVYITNYTITSIVYLFFPYFLANIFSSIAALFIVTLAYKTKWSKRFISVFVMYLTAFISEAIVAFIIGIAGYSDYIFRKEHYGDVLTLVLALVIKFAIIKLISRFNNIVEYSDFSWHFIASTIIVPSVSVYLEIQIFRAENISTFTYITSLLSILALNFIVLYMFDSIANAYKEKINYEISIKETEHYQKQAELIQKNFESTRQLRHDFKNHTIALKEYISRNENNQAIRYLDSISDMLQPTKMYCSTGIVAIDSIINYKLSEAYDKGIIVNSQITIPNDINFDSKDFVAILGNLLDNAIEAAMEAPNKKYINIKIEYSVGTIFIIIKNSFSGKLNISNGTIKTTKKDSSTPHGMGMESIKTAIQKNKGEFITSYSEEEFTSKVLFMI